MKKTPLLSLFLAFTCLSGLQSQPDSFNLTLCSRFWATDSAGPAWYFTPTGGNPAIGAYASDSICGQLLFYPASSAGGYCPRARCPKQDFINGVTIRDAWILRDHVLGFQQLSSDVQLFAGDLNRSGGSPNNFDLYLLRRLLLGLADTLPDRLSWCMIFENQIYLKPTNPLENPCPGVNYVPPATQGEAKFISIKLGDLDGDAQPNGSYKLPQEYSSVEFQVPDLMLTTGNTYDIPVALRPTWTSLGLQAAFQFKQDSLEILSVENGQIDLIQDLNYTIDSHAVIRLTPLFDEQIVLKQGFPLFTLRIKATQNCRLRHAMAMLLDTLPAFLLDFEGHIHPATVRFYQTSNSALQPLADATLSVSPNPFRKTSRLNFTLEKPGEAQLELRSATGALAATWTQYFAAGPQTWEIVRPAVTAPQWWFYTLRCGDGVINGKILQIP